MHHVIAYKMSDHASAHFYAEWIEANGMSSCRVETINGHPTLIVITEIDDLPNAQAQPR